MIWITYTTLYREGGAKFAKVARTMAREKEKEFPETEVRCEAVESKRAFLDGLDRIRSEGKTIDELHFIGHSGVYGIMFGTRAWPEQFSPHEWRTMSIPFSEGASASFHACRTARWFAPFIARTFNVRASGYYWYTCFSRSSDHFSWDLSGPEPVESDTSSLYVISIAGRKSHGLIGSLLKYSGLRKTEPLLSFTPEESAPDTSYDRVAELYDEAFADITVREDEWKWLMDAMPQETDIDVLDIGCGNGSLLSALSHRIRSGTGVDASRAMVERARKRFGSNSKLTFRTIDGPLLPLDDQSIDVVISFMSFRYLDWDPIMSEIDRVLRPGGSIIIIDMAASPARLRDIPSLLRSRLRHRSQRRRHPDFEANLARLVSDPDWERMLRYNPVRAEHEYRWYLSSRFPDGEITTLNLGMTHRLLAFVSRDKGQKRTES